MPKATTFSKKENEKRIQLILDLDNTVISSLSPREYKKIGNRKLQYSDMDKYYRVYWRPYLQEFLDYVFSNFHVSIWTAASRDYASFILENIIFLPDKKRKLRLYLWDDNCLQSQKIHNPHAPKDLNYLYHFEGFHPCNTIIIDDLKDVQKINPNHTIPAKYFDAADKNSEKDTFLKDVIPILENIKKKYSKTKCILHEH